MDPTGPTARRFPLVARSRPPCTPLTDRVRRLSDLADTAERAEDLAAASAVFNLAALIASDCGLPDLAREWCHHHARLYLTARPLSAAAARHALEPLVNLARLHIRDGHGDQAFQLLEDLYRAVTDRADTVIDGIELPAGDLTRTDQDHRELVQWLWTVHLSDSPRALISAGRWADAHEHLHRHHGIGQRMLDGRQIAIIARTLAGDPEQALHLLQDAEPEEPWEHTVAACLRVLCRPGDTRPTDLEQMVRSFRQVAPAPHLALFHTRLALSVLDAGDSAPQLNVPHLVDDLICQTITYGDGYAAREILAHHGCTTITTQPHAAQLQQILHACALGSQELPAALKDDLDTALRTASALISHSSAGDRSMANR